MRTIAMFLVFSALAVAAPAADPGAETPTITITASGKVAAPADLAIVFLRVQSQAPLAADALKQTADKVVAVRKRLAELGYEGDQVRFSGNRFSPAGGGMYYPGGQRPTGFQVYNSLYVFVEGDDLKDLPQFNAKVGALLDELSKLGASTVNTPISRYSMGGVSVVAFTAKDPTAAESEAFHKAIEKARPIAEMIAKKMGVTITGIQSVASSPATPRLPGGQPNPLNDLPYEYYSSSRDEVPVRVRAEVRFSYK